MSPLAGTPPFPSPRSFPSQTMDNSLTKPRPRRSPPRERRPLCAAVVAAFAAAAALLIVALLVPLPAAAGDLFPGSGGACASRPLRDASFVATVFDCTANPSRCSVADNLFCARDGGCCYSESGCSPQGARLVPFVCKPSTGAVTPAPAGVCARNHVATIGLGL